MLQKIFLLRFTACNCLLMSLQKPKYQGPRARNIGNIFQQRQVIYLRLSYSVSVSQELAPTISSISNWIFRSRIEKAKEVGQFFRLPDNYRIKFNDLTYSSGSTIKILSHFSELFHSYMTKVINSIYHYLVKHTQIFLVRFLFLQSTPAFALTSSCEHI